MPWLLWFAGGRPQPPGARLASPDGTQRQSCSRDRARGCLPWVLLRSTMPANISHLCQEMDGNTRQNSASLELNSLLQRCPRSQQGSKVGKERRLQGCAWLCFLVRRGQAHAGASPPHPGNVPGQNLAPNLPIHFNCKTQHPDCQAQLLTIEEVELSCHLTTLLLQTIF